MFLARVAATRFVFAFVRIDHRVAKVIGVGHDDGGDRPELLEMFSVVIGERQRIDCDVPSRAHPQHAVKVEIAVLVERGPAE